MGCDISDLITAQTIKLEDLKNKKIAIDGNNILYQFLSSIRQPDGSLLMDSHGNITAHLSGLFYRTLKWLENGLLPIFVFDGKPPEFKSKTLLKRTERKEIASEKFSLALQEGDLEQAYKFAQQTSKLSKEMIEESKELLEALGLPFVQAPSEGEAQAVYLLKSNYAWGVASQDYDSLLFGAERLIRYLSFSSKRKLPNKNIYVSVEPELINLTKVLDDLKINQRQLIWIGLLVGTDFNQGVKNVGPKTALKLVSQSNSFEEIIKKLYLKFPNKKEEIDYSLENWQEIENFFLSPPIEKNLSIVFGDLNKEKIFSLLVDKHDFSSERVEKAISNYESIKKATKSQSRLDDFFS